MILQIPDVLNADQVAHARRLLDEATWVDGRVTAGHAGGAGEGQHAARRRATRSRAQIGDQVLGALQRNPLFVSAALPLQGVSAAVQPVRGGESFGNHVDNAIRQSVTTGVRIRTDLSATLFLADPEEYDGGELMIEDTYGVHSAKLPAGHMVLYPSTSLHNVRPVTSGARIASFFWIQSMVRDDGAADAALRPRHRDSAAYAGSAGTPRGRAAHRRVPQPAAPMG